MHETFLLPQFKFFKKEHPPGVSNDLGWDHLRNEKTSIGSGISYHGNNQKWNVTTPK